MRKVYRSEENKIFAGIIGGLGEHFDIDPTLLRLIWLLILIFTGVIPGLIVYIVAVFVVPKKSRVAGGAPVYEHTKNENGKGEKRGGE